MSSPSVTSPQQDLQCTMLRSARLPGLRALAWSDDLLYAVRGYDLLRAQVKDASRELLWQPVGYFSPSWKRKISASTRLSSRLLRDGFHALAALPTGVLVGAVPGAIVT